MPELPVIGPAGPVQIGGDIPKIPRRLPISEALAAGGQDVASKLFELAKGIRAQKLRQTDATATIDYTNKLNQLRKETAALPDLDQQQKYFQTGINKIQDEFKAAAPNLGTLTVQSIADKISNDDREFALHNTEQKYKKGVADVHQSLEDLKRLSVASDDKNTRDMLFGQAKKLIEDTKNNGFLDGPTAKAMWDKFQTETRTAEFNRLAHENPEKVMNMHPGDVAIPPTQFFNIQAQAYQALTNRQSLGRAHFEQEKNQHLQEVVANPALAQEYVSRGWVTPAEGSMVAGRLIETRPPNDTLVAHLQQQLQNFRGSPQEYDNFYIKTILPALEGANSNDKQQVNREYTDNRRDLNNTSKNHANDIENEVRDKIQDVDRLTGAEYITGIVAKPLIDIRNRTIRHVKQQLKEAKTIQEMDKIRDETLKQIPLDYKAAGFSMPGEARPTKGTETKPEDESTFRKD